MLWGLIPDAVGCLGKRHSHAATSERRKIPQPRRGWFFVRGRRAARGLPHDYLPRRPPGEDVLVKKSRNKILYQQTPLKTDSLSRLKGQKRLWITPAIVPARSPTPFSFIVERNNDFIFLSGARTWLFQRRVQLPEGYQLPPIDQHGRSLFLGVLNTPDVSTGDGGGGSQSDLTWSDKDENVLQWAVATKRK